MHWIGFKTLVLRESRVIIRFWIVTLAPPIITTILYFTIFGGVLGERIGAVDGINYTQFISPGLILLWVIPYSYGHTAAGFLGARVFKYIEELQISPLPGWVVMMGYVIGGVLRGVLVGMVAAVITLLFTHEHVHSISMSIAILLLAALVSALGGFVTAIWAKSFDQVTTIQISILTPLAYFGGVFNSLTTLPNWAQKLSLANPIFYMVNAFRYSFLGISDVSVGLASSVVIVSSVVLFFAALQLMTRTWGIRN
jgi:ABC-2 type transport system permease protein